MTGAPGRPRTYATVTRTLHARVAQAERSAVASGTSWLTGTVTTVTPGAASDGSAAAYITWAGGAGWARYAAGYVPYAGDTVLLALPGGEPIAVGALPGTAYGYGDGPYGDEPYGG